MAERRVLKAPAVRRAELIDCAQCLFLTRGYEATTINDVINATGVSKGAFYHHFRAKEDLLEAIARRFAGDCVDFCEALHADAGPGRPSAAEPVPGARPQLEGRAHRRVEDDVHHPAATGERCPAPAHRRGDDGRAGAGAGADHRAGPGRGCVRRGRSTQVAADALLWLSNGRRGLEITAIALAETNVEAAIEMIATRVHAEEVVICRILGLPSGGSVDLLPGT